MNPWLKGAGLLAGGFLGYDLFDEIGDAIGDAVDEAVDGTFLDDAIAGKPSTLSRYTDHAIDHTGTIGGIYVTNKAIQGIEGDQGGPRRKPT